MSTAYPNSGWLIKSLNPGHSEGMDERHDPADSGKERDGNIDFWLKQIC